MVDTLETATAGSVALSVHNSSSQPGAEQFVHVPFSMLGNPEEFLETDDGQVVLKHISSDYYYSQYYRDRGDGLSLKEGTKLGGEMLSVGPDGNMYEAIEAHFGHGQSTSEYFRYTDHGDLNSVLDEIEEAADENDLPDFDREEWEDAIKDNLREILEQEDDSSVTDMLDSHDRCEVFFTFRRNANEDGTISMHSSGGGLADVQIDRNLQFTLSRLGYTIPEFRLMSGNIHKSDSLIPGVRPRPEKLVSPKGLQDIVVNSCSSWFHIGLYAVVPITEILALERGKPIVLTGFHIASYDSCNGTFHDHKTLGSITVTAADGIFEACNGGYSPDDICGLVTSHYVGSVKNPEVENIIAANDTEPASVVNIAA